MKKESFFVLLLSAFLLTGCVTSAESTSDKYSSTNNSSALQSQSSQMSESISSTSFSSKTDTALELVAPENDVHTDLQYSYLKDPNWRNIKLYIPTTGADGGNLGDKSHPKALALKFEEVANAEKYYVQVSKDNTFANAEVFQTQSKVYNFYNAEIGTKYYYRAATSEEALATATVKEYQTNDLAPRNLHIEGVINFRDAGGWKSSLVENGCVKQGLYYRCAQFNNIKTAGKAELKRLGIKLDIDMRDRPPSSSPATSNDWQIGIMDAHVASGTESIRWEGSNGIAATYKKIFEAVAEADVKPIALHCTHGADRTGIMSFFLLGLLGVSKDDIGRDYVLTRFAGERAVLPETEFDNWVSKTEALAGATFAEKTYKHLKDDFNISIDTLETIREKFVPGYTRPAAA